MLFGLSESFPDKFRICGDDGRFVEASLPVQKTKRTRSVAPPCQPADIFRVVHSAWIVVRGSPRLPCDPGSAARRVGRGRPPSPRARTWPGSSWRCSAPRSLGVVAGARVQAAGGAGGFKTSQGEQHFQADRHADQAGLIRHRLERLARNSSPVTGAPVTGAASSLEHDHGSLTGWAGSRSNSRPTDAAPIYAIPTRRLPAASRTARPGAGAAAWAAWRPDTARSRTPGWPGR